MRIDAHVHLYDPMRLSLAWPPKGDVFYRRFEMPEFLEATRETPVDGAIVVACSSETELMDDLAARYRNEEKILALIGQVEDGENGFKAYYGRYTAEAKFRGLRIPARTEVTPALMESVQAMALAAKVRTAVRPLDALREVESEDEGHWDSAMEAVCYEMRFRMLCGR